MRRPSQFAAHRLVAAIALTLVAAWSPIGARAADTLSAGERAAVFQAAGAVRQGARWVICTDDPDTGGATIEQVRDLDGDGRPDVVVTEDGTFCNGAAGTGFVVLGGQADGGWRRMLQSPGVPEFVRGRGKDGWPDVSVGGPGFCFPVLRWNGTDYALDRHEYEGKPCTPP